MWSACDPLVATAAVTAVIILVRRFMPDVYYMEERSVRAATPISEPGELQPALEKSARSTPRIMQEEQDETRSRNWKLPFFTISTGQAESSLLGSGLSPIALVSWLTITTGSAVVLATAPPVGLLHPILFQHPLPERSSIAGREMGASSFQDTSITVFTALLAILF